MKIKISIIGSFVGKFLVAVLFIIWSFSCVKEENPDSNPIKNEIIGKWDWYLTIVPKPHTVITPITEGYTAALKFEPTDSVQFFKNDTLTKTYRYEIKYRIDNFQDPNSDSTLVLIINNGIFAFFSIENDTLITDYTYVDGPKNFYSRNK